jgi:hypothetical protein
VRFGFLEFGLREAQLGQVSLPCFFMTKRC